ncbi:MAG: NTP transferase domain-containing protein [Phycisphaerales bacterium]|nr:NTP transferase domain-containing protein [Phycisphaerales bacterium]
MSANDRVLAVVIGRAGSRGLPGKNARLVAGRPMIAHAIAHALESTSVDETIVSTDGAEIAAAARAMGVPVIDRPAALADDHATVDDAVRHAVGAHGAPAGIIVILYGNIPVRPPDLTDCAVAELRRSGADSVQSYSTVGKHHPFWMMQIDDDHRVTPYVENTVYRRQDLPPLVLPDGGVIAVRRTALMTVVPGRPHAFLGADRRGIVNESGAVVDVDDAVDLAVAEAILAHRAEAVS